MLALVVGDLHFRLWLRDYLRIFATFLDREFGGDLLVDDGFLCWLDEHLLESFLVTFIDVACALVFSANVATFFEESPSLNAPNLLLKRILELLCN